MPEEETSQDAYKRGMEKLRSIGLSTLIKSAPDKAAREKIELFPIPLEFSAASRHDLLIEEGAWQHIIERGYPPALVFCHPTLLSAHPSTSLHYRGMTGLSQKAVGQMARSVAGAENKPDFQFRDPDAVRSIARLYNLFLSSIILASEGWALENGYRTILATMGISFDGSSRNKVGDIAEQKMRTILLKYIVDTALLASDEQVNLEEPLRAEYRLKDHYSMRFSDEPDVYFVNAENRAIATIEIKGGLDPAGALERLGAAQRSFLHAIRATANCKTYLVAGVVTKTMEERLLNDRNFTKHFALVDIVTHQDKKDEFLRELFHYGLRII